MGTLGALHRITAKFYNLAGALTDTTVTVTVTSPSGVVTSPAATWLTTGTYYYEHTPTEPGGWTYRFVGSGAVKAPGETIVQVLP